MKGTTRSPLDPTAIRRARVYFRVVFLDEPICKARRAEGLGHHHHTEYLIVTDDAAKQVAEAAFACVGVLGLAVIGRDEQLRPHPNNHHLTRKKLLTSGAGSLPDAEVAERLGMHEKAVSAARRRFGIPHRGMSQKMAQARASFAKQHRQVLTRYTLTAAGKILNRDVGWLRRVCDEAGIERGHDSGRPWEPKPLTKEELLGAGAGLLNDGDVARKLCRPRSAVVSGRYKYVIPAATQRRKWNKSDLLVMGAGVLSDLAVARSIGQADGSYIGTLRNLFGIPAARTSKNSLLLWANFREKRGVKGIHVIRDAKGNPTSVAIDRKVASVETIAEFELHKERDERLRGKGEKENS